MNLIIYAYEQKMRLRITGSESGRDCRNEKNNRYHHGNKQHRPCVDFRVYAAAPCRIKHSKSRKERLTMQFMVCCMYVMPGINKKKMLKKYQVSCI